MLYTYMLASTMRLTFTSSVRLSLFRNTFVCASVSKILLSLQAAMQPNFIKANRFLSKKSLLSAGFFFPTLSNQDFTSPNFDDAGKMGRYKADPLSLVNPTLFRRLLLARSHLPLSYGHRRPEVVGHARVLAGGGLVTKVERAESSHLKEQKCIEKELSSKFRSGG